MNQLIPLQVTGRCSARVVFAPIAGARFVADAGNLAQALTCQFSAAELESEDSWAAVLYRWLRDHDRHDQTLTPVPDCLEIETAMEQSFQRAAARAFCVCCNRNYLRPHTRFIRRPDRSQYVCPEGHLLLSIEETHTTAAVATIAA